MMPMVEVENRMVVDSEWDEEEYHAPSKARLRREKKLYDRLEQEDIEDGE